jgi:hypothetical protein
MWCYRLVRPSASDFLGVWILIVRLRWVPVPLRRVFGPSQSLYLRAHYNTGNANPSCPTAIWPHDRTRLFLRDFVGVVIYYCLLKGQQAVKFALCTPRCTRGEGGEYGVAPLILNLDITWRWVVSFMPRPLYPRFGKENYSLYWKSNHDSWGFQPVV